MIEGQFCVYMHIEASGRLRLLCRHSHLVHSHTPNLSCIALPAASLLSTQSSGQRTLVDYSDNFGVKLRITHRKEVVFT